MNRYRPVIVAETLLAKRRMSQDMQQMFLGYLDRECRMTGMPGYREPGDGRSTHPHEKNEEQ